MLRKTAGLLFNNGNNGSKGKEQQIPFEDIRAVSKKQIELFEHWSRRLIDDFFRNNYGDDYLNASMKSGNPLVKAEIKKGIQERRKSDPNRYQRDIDAILLDDIQYFLIRPDLYKLFFQGVLEPFYSGKEEIRSILERLKNIRNKLSHDNPISIREAEQAVCYTNDFIDVYKEYYKRIGAERDFNVPVVISLSDSQGNITYRKDTNSPWEVHNTRDEDITYYKSIFPEAITTNHRSGEEYIVDLEVDSSFPKDSYLISWKVIANYHEYFSGEGSIITVVFNNELVSRYPSIEIKLTTKKTWHRFANRECDDYVEIHLNKVLPPIEDSY